MAVLLLTMQSEVYAQLGKLYPVDESGKDQSFALFKARLIDALKRRDRNYLMSIVDPKIKNSFGGNDGAANFVKQWHPEKPKSKVWDVILTALQLGGTFEGSGAGKSFCAPYVYTRFPDHLDPFTHQVIIAGDVPVHARPSASARVKETVSYEIIEVAADADKGWVKIMLKSGEGFVRESQIRSSVNYRLCFQRVRGKWMLILLLAGD